MKKTFMCSSLLLCSIVFTNCKSGLVTTTNGCYNALQAAEASNNAANYSSALDQYNKILDQCKAYDAKEKAYAGKAEALNGLHEYNDALAAANEGLRISKTSIDNLFERASAELGLNMNAEAKADLAQVVDLTQKNRNVKERATIYAKMAEIDLRQNMYNDALNNVDAAITADNTNADFYILKGDVYAAQNDYTNAMTAYNQAVQSGGNNAKVWQAKVEAETKAMQKKYGTGTNAADLAGKMSQADKKMLCSDIRTAKTNGVKSTNLDLLQISICK